MNMLNHKLGPVTETQSFFFRRKPLKSRRSKKGRRFFAEKYLSSQKLETILAILNITYARLKLHNTLDLCSNYCNVDVYEK